MARRPASWRYSVALGGGFFVLAIALALVAAALRSKGGLADAVNVAALVSFALAILPPARFLWSWWRTKMTASAVTTQQIAVGKDVLANLVSQQWRTEVAMWSLDDPDPIPVQWRITQQGEVMDHPGSLTAASLTLTGSSDDIGALACEFRRMRRRRLVLLGGPGAGKTTLAVQLLRELLATRSRQEDEPVPVLLPAAGWDTDTYPRLQDWLGMRLVQDYPALRAPSLAPGMARILADYGQILPVLDGLDELPQPAQAAVITALNRSMDDTGQLILTSRTDEFEQAVNAADDVLTSAVVIEPQAVEPAIAAGYLRRCLPPGPGDAWERILASLHSTSAESAGPASALAEITATPLGLWLLRTVYITGRANPGPLLEPAQFPDTATLRAHLFAQLIPALVSARPPSYSHADLFRPRRQYDPARVRRWLGYLARYLSRLPAADGTIGTRDFTWWHLAQGTNAITRKTQLAIGLTAAIAAVAAFTAVFAIKQEVVFGDTGRIVIGPAYGLRLSLAFALGTGLAIGLAARSWPAEEPGIADLRIRGRILLMSRKLMAGLVPGLAFGLVFAVWLTHVFGLEDGLEVGLAGLVAGLILSAVFGLMAWAEAPTPTNRAGTPLTSWQSDRSLTLIRGIAVGLASGIVSWLAFGLEFGLVFVPSGIPFTHGLWRLIQFRLSLALPYGLSFGLVSGLTGGLLGGPAGRITGRLVSGLVLGVVGLLVYEFAGAPYGLADSPSVLVYGIAGGIAGLLMGGLAGRSNVGRRRAWAAYLVATYRLACAGLLPRNLMLFLDDAHRLGLLRAVGPIYQFRHAEFHDYLADTYCLTHSAKGSEQCRPWVTEPVDEVY